MPTRSEIRKAARTVLEMVPIGRPISQHQLIRKLNEYYAKGTAPTPPERKNKASRRAPDSRKRQQIGTTGFVRKSEADIRRTFEDLAHQITCKEEYWAFANEAWQEVHSVRHRGRPSVQDQCFDAIMEAIELLSGNVIDRYGIIHGCKVCNRKECYPTNDPDWHADHRFPIGRLVEMIRRRHPDIPLVTARKYARKWDALHPPLDPAARRNLYTQTKQKFPTLY
jgi:hypothetical protein